MSLLRRTCAVKTKIECNMFCLHSENYIIKLSCVRSVSQFNEEKALLSRYHSVGLRVCCLPSIACTRSMHVGVYCTWRFLSIVCLVDCKAVCFKKWLRYNGMTTVNPLVSECLKACQQLHTRVANDVQNSTFSDWPNDVVRNDVT